MADSHSKEVRSFNMSRIKSTDTKPELAVRKHLHQNGFRYRLHHKDLPGKPDIVLPKYHTVIFVHGCFWHGHEGCSEFIMPKTRPDYWPKKIGRNVANDFKHQAILTAQGWRVLTVWECGLKRNCRSKTLARLLDEISGPPESEGFVE